ncbi:histidinol phosphate phosphatase domain-containing protein [Limisalsivibrio acetivorans]|uniref:histidinol phosphate phosphatase domain-containing protein n=1 Tax=Limisalsivibrio acetivorans TaxID=1304888 RepID=UPI0003B5C3CB|nr:histidinol phosphate phosphatase domain-containing protein [Limisalsivibrio acetivorans]
MFDLHTHTVFSDGSLIPAESARRARAAGYGGIAFTDHADDSNLLFILENLLRFKEQFNSQSPEFKVLAGVELTHILPASMDRLTQTARRNGADIVIVHGETLTEPVEPGTNIAAIDAGIDILAHPGLISPEEVKRAAKIGVNLEITTRRGHSITNGHVAKTALENGCSLVINNDFHAPGDSVSPEAAFNILMGAGLSSEEAGTVMKNNERIFKKALEDSIGS